MTNDIAAGRPERTATTARPSGEPAKPRGAGPTVGIVEDQEAIAEMLADVLDEDGYRSVRLTPPYHAAQIVAAGADVLLLDIVLGQVSGWDVLDAVRTDPATRDLPTIITSGLYDRPGLHTLPAGGPIVFMPKPFDISELIATIERLVAPGTSRPVAVPNADLGHDRR